LCDEFKQNIRKGEEIKSFPRSNLINSGVLKKLYLTDYQDKSRVILGLENDINWWIPLED
jgi:hypothetical protein